MSHTDIVGSGNLCPSYRKKNTKAMFMLCFFEQMQRRYLQR